MKKLKKFVLHDAVRLSREEMASIEGMDLCIVDVCTQVNQLCIYSQEYVDGHSVITVGTCHMHTKNVDGQVITTWSCD